MKTKICFQCGKRKSLDTEYYPNAYKRCKVCTRQNVDKRYKEKMKDPVFQESEKKRGREKYHRLYQGVYSTTRFTRKKYWNKFPEVRKAHFAVFSIKVGDGKHKHHWSYLAEHRKDFIVMVAADHYTIHRFLQYDADEMKFRTIDGVLLETRDQHEKYIEQILTKEKCGIS